VETEDERGVPFIGRPGQLLKSKAAVAGIPSEQCMFTNTVWCAPRPVRGAKIGTPTPEECLQCLPHVLGVIAVARPQVIVAVGAKAFEALTGKSGITKFRGRWHEMVFSAAHEYEAFRMWVRAACSTEKVAAILSSSPNLKVYYGTHYDPATQGDLCVGQMSSAATDIGYDVGWKNTRVMPIIHPAALLRGGLGTQSQMSEDMVDDLKKAKDSVDGISTAPVHKSYRWIVDLDDLQQYVDETIEMYKAGSLPYIAVDCETNKTDDGTVFLLCFNPSVRVLTIQVSRRDFEGVTIMVNHRDSKFNDSVSMDMVRHHIRRLLQTVPSVYQNAMFDLSVFRTKLGIDGVKIVGDTLLAAHWLTCGAKQGYGLDDLGARYLGTGKHKTTAKKWDEENPGKDFDEMPLEIALDYSSGDSDVTRRVWGVLRNLLSAEGRLDSYLDHYFGPHDSWRVLFDLAWYGMPIEPRILADLIAKYPEKIAKAREKINEHPDVVDYLRGMYRLDCMEKEAHNAACVENKRRRRKTILPFEAWRKDAPFLPTSVPATVALWKKMRIPEVMFPHLKDIEFADEDCPTCGRRCRCDPTYRPQKFKTSEHNRTIIGEACRGWAEQYRAAGKVAEAEKCQRYAELMSVLSEFKTLDKLNGTYVEGIQKLIVDRPDTSDPAAWDPTPRVYELYRPFHAHPRPWSLHPSYNMHGTTTGRLSSSGPNAQNFPSSSDAEAGNVKAPYVSRWRGKGGLLVQPDFSQVEVRVLVALCRDENMAAVLNGGKDIHRYVASVVHGIPEDKVTDDLRKPVKRVTFGVLYGQSVPSLAQELKITESEARHIQNTLFATFPKVKEFVDLQHNFAIKRGYVESLTGRRRYLGAMEPWGAKYDSYCESKRTRGEVPASSESWLTAVLKVEPGDIRFAVSEAYRESVNTPIQGVASDLCWQAFGRTWKHLREMGVECCPHSIIHDSQCFDVAPGQWLDLVTVQYYQMVYKTQVVYPWMVVKPDVDFSMGTSWGQLANLKLVWTEDGTLDPTHFSLSGYKEDIDAVVAELHAGGMLPVVAKSGPHPKEEEAKRGKFCAEISVTRNFHRCDIIKKELILAKRE
jgi:uracil-DNA glycosylase family 4